MKKIKGIGIAIVLLFIGAFSYFIMNFGPIISGFGAKAVCSCVYVGNRSVESVIKNELGAFPLNLGTFEWNESDKSTSGSVFGLAKSKAIFREGLGCTLVREISEVEIRRAKTHVDLNRPVLNDTVYWPRGKKLADTVSHDLDMKKLNFAISSAFENTNIEIPANTRSVLVVYKGQLILEQYADGFDKDAPQLGWSMAKSVTNMLYGVMTKKGWIDVNDPAPVHEWRNDNRAAITSDQLLRMSSGLYWEEVYSSVSTATNMLYRYSNMGDFALGQPLHTKPEQEWVYSSGSTNILSKIIRDKIDSSSYYHFAQDELFSKIGITTAIIEPDAAGTFVGSSYMWASARDWARLGMLYLNNGEWYGEQIIDPEWVKYTVTPTPKAAAGEYGSQWWLNAGEKGNENNRILPNVPTDMYMMDGYEGQRVFVVPSFDLVVVRLGQNKKGGFDYDGFLSSIISCIDK